MERFVWSPEIGLLHDLRSKAPGRGARVHADPECLQKAAKSGFKRSFRAQVEVDDLERFVSEVETAIRTRLTESLRLAVRSQAAGVGAKAVDKQMKTNTAEVMFVAHDAGEATRKKYLANASRKNLQVVESFDGATIGGWSGREFVAVMTLGGRLAQSAFRDVQSLERLSRVEG